MWGDIKFRDPKTGDVFENMNDVMNHVECDAKDCITCPMSSLNNGTGLACVSYAKKFAVSAARILGFELVVMPV